MFNYHLQTPPQNCAINKLSYTQKCIILCVFQNILCYYPNIWTFFFTQIIRLNMIVAWILYTCHTNTNFYHVWTSHADLSRLAHTE